MELVFVPEGESDMGGWLGWLKPPSDKTSTSPRAKPWGFESGLSESRRVQTAAAAAAAEWDEVEEKARLGRRPPGARLLPGRRARKSTGFLLKSFNLFILRRWEHSQI